MFTTVVVGTNWSETAEVALVRALELARAGGGRLHVVTASPPSPPPASGRSAGASGSRSLGPDFHADVVLDQTLERLGGGDVDVRQHTATAEPGDAILAVAEQVGADLIVVGTGGLRPPTSGFAGSPPGDSPARARQHPEHGVAPGQVRRADRADRLNPR